MRFYKTFQVLWFLPIVSTYCKYISDSVNWYIYFAVSQSLFFDISGGFVYNLADILRI